jgi:hypothetical protein
MALRKITHSEASTFNRCRQRWYFEYELCLRKKIEKHYFFIGRHCHAALLECAELKLLRGYERPSTADVVDYFQLLCDKQLELYREKYPELIEDISLLNHQRDLGTAILTGYMQKCFPHNTWKQCELLRPGCSDPEPAIEIVFQLPVTTPSGNPSNKFRRIGRIDQIVKYQNLYWLRELKFMSSFDSADVKWLAKDPQITSYTWAAEKYFNISIAGCIYDVCKKSKLRQGKTEDIDVFRRRIISDYQSRPEFYFEQHFVRFNRKDIDAAPERMYLMCKDMNNPRLYGAEPFICIRTGCDFQDVCLAGSDEERNSILSHYFMQKEAKHEELL